MMKHEESPIRGYLKASPLEYETPPKIAPKLPVIVIGGGVSG